MGVIISASSFLLFWIFFFPNGIGSLFGHVSSGAQCVSPRNIFRNIFAGLFQYVLSSFVFSFTGIWSFPLGFSCDIASSGAQCVFKKHVL